MGNSESKASQAQPAFLGSRTAQFFKDAGLSPSKAPGSVDAAITSLTDRNSGTGFDSASSTNDSNAVPQRRATLSRKFTRLLNKKKGSGSIYGAPIPPAEWAPLENVSSPRDAPIARPSESPMDIATPYSGAAHLFSRSDYELGRKSRQPVRSHTTGGRKFELPTVGQARSVLDIVSPFSSHTPSFTRSHDDLRRSNSSPTGRTPKIPRIRSNTFVPNLEPSKEEQEATDWALAEQLHLEEVDEILAVTSQTYSIGIVGGPSGVISNNNPFRRNIGRESDTLDPSTALPALVAEPSHGKAKAYNWYDEDDEQFARRLRQDDIEREKARSPAIKAGPIQNSDSLLAAQLRDEVAGEPANVPARDCTVCGETVPIPDLPALMNCCHEPQVCRECYASWIASELESKGWRRVGCPDSACKQRLAHTEVQQYASSQVFEKFDTLSAREAFNDDPNFRWCRGPKCGFGQIHLGGAADPIFTCSSCGFKVCVIHDGTWHEGETCDEYDYRVSGRKEKDQAAQEKASRAAVKKLSKKCPGKDCSYNIEKADGCDHMSCSKCGHEFCWVCLVDYTSIRNKGNSAHKKLCKNWRP